MLKKWVSAATAAVFALLPMWAQAQSMVEQEVHARFATLPPHVVPGVKFSNTTATSLSQWNGSFVDRLGRTVNYTMVGPNPATSNTSSSVKTLIIPIKMVYGANNGNTTFDPAVDTVSNGSTVVANILASPLFTKTVSFKTGGVKLGKTQYIDAFQRGNFWSSVSTNTGYHVLLKPEVLPEVTITVTAAQGRVISNPFAAGVVGLMDIFEFDNQLQSIMSSLRQVAPNVLPLFVTDNIFLTEFGGCCIGGYHSANGAQPNGQTYSYSTYVTSPGSFSQDVSALSHELGEWMDDPFTNNSVNCNDNGILEVGDPLEGRANYGGFPYTVNGFTYNLQSMVYLPYFGAPKSTSVNGWYSFQNDEASVCPGQ